MRQGGGRLARLSRARSARSITALALGLSVASTGFVALAAPALAAGAVAPTITVSPATPDSVATPSWSFAGGAGLYECSFGPTTAPTVFTACVTPYTAPTISTDGGYTFAVREAVAGTPPVATSDYTYDTIGTATIVAPPSPGNDVTPTWNVTPETGATATCSVDGRAAVACAGSFTPATALFGEGSHTLTVAITDALGNTGTATSGYVLDTTAPAAPVVTGSNGPGNTGSVAWSWPRVTGETGQCTLTTPTTTVPPTSCSSGTFSQAISTEGSYALSVVLTDQAGNVGPAGAGPTYLYDRTAPAVPTFGSVPPATATDPQPTWAFTSPGPVTTCQLRGASLGLQPAVPCSASFTPGTPLADDSWTLIVQAKDAATNTSSVTSPAYRLDTTGPAAPVVSGPTALGNNAQPTFTWTGELPSSAQCRIVLTDPVSGVTYGDWSDCTARFFTPTLALDGNYQVQAQLTDPLGNQGAIGTSGTYPFDGTPPPRPVVSGPGGLGRNTTPSFTFTPESGGTALCDVVLNGVASGPAACSGGTYTPTLLRDGSYLVEVTTVDAAGNSSPVGTATYQLDATAPGVPVLVAPASPGRTLAPSWTITGDGDSTLSCQLLAGGVPLGGSARTCTSGYLGDLAGQPDGTYLLEVTATDPAGNTSVAVSSYVLDTLAPNAPVVTGPASPGNALSPLWTFPVQPGTTAQCRLVQGLSLGAWADCSIGRYTVTGLVDGSYTVDVLVTDLAGNPAPVASSPSYSSDRTVPVAPTVTGPAGKGKNPSPVWTWTGETGTTPTCRLDRNGVVGSAVPCGSPTGSGTFSPATSGDASYQVVVFLTDPAGNVGPATTTASYALDTAAPVAPVVLGPTGVGSNPNPSFAFTTEPGAVTECQLVANGVGGGWNPCTSPLVLNLGTDGTYLVQVRATDAALNTSAVGSSASYAYDGTAPAAPLVTAPASPSNVVTPVVFSYTAEAQAATQCRTLRSGVIVTDWTGCTSPYTVDLTGQPDGSYVVQVRATDAALNTGPVGDSPPYVLDVTAPDSPLVTGPAGPSTNATPAFSFTGELGTTAMCRLVHNGVQDITATPCTSPFTPTLVGDGSWSIRVRLTDRAGNRSLPGLSGNYVLDTVAPVTPVVTSPPSPGRGTLPAWSATIETGATSECQLSDGNGAVLQPWAPCVLPLTTDLRSRSDGAYTLSVRATDAAGLTSGVGTATYVLDTTAPLAPVFTTLPASPSKLRSVVFGFTAEAGSVTTCRLSQGSTVLSPDTTCVSPLPVTFLPGVDPDGSYSLTVTATDRAGNSGSSQSATYVLDTTAPSVPVLVSGPASVSPDKAPKWTFTADAGAVVTCRVTGAASGVVFPDAPCTSPYQVTLAVDDSYTFSARATDEAGNASPGALSSAYVLDSKAPPTAVVVGPTTPGSSLSPTWQVSAPEGTVQCQLVKGGVVLVKFGICGPTFSYPITPKTKGGSDGLYVLSAHVLDAAGNTSSDVFSRYVLDTLPPSPAVLTTPASPSNGRSPTWTVASSDASATAQCQVLGPNGAPVVPFGACAVSAAGSPYLLDLVGAKDGPWTLVVKLTDTAGNVSALARGTYTLDTVTPNLVLVTAPPSPSFDALPTWRLTGDSDAGLECRLSGPGLSTGFSPCASTSGVPGSGSFTADLTTRPDGTYTLTVRSRDAAGNLGPESTSGYVIDRVAPATPEPPLVAASPSPQSTVSWDFSVERGTTALCTLVTATALVSPEQPCTSPWLTNLAVGPLGDVDGDYALRVRAVDPAGNRSSAAVSHYVYDTTAPAPPTITRSPGSPSPVTAPTWGLSASSSSDALECQLVGTVLPTWASCSDPVSFGLGAAAGTYRLQVREIDPAGNVSTATSSGDYVLDASAALPPQVLPPLPAIGHSTRPVFRIVRPAGDLVTDHLTCSARRFDGAPARVSPCAFGDNTVDLTGLRGTGPVTVTAQSVTASTTSAAATAVYAFDDAAPGTPQLLAPLESPSFVGTVTWTFGGVLDADHYVCALRRSTEAGPVAPVTCTSPSTTTLPSVGTYSYAVWAVDAAGNQSATPVTGSYTFLPSVPTPPAARTASVATDATPTWTFSVPVGYTADCLLGLPGGQGLVYECTAPVAAPRSISAPAAALRASAQNPQASRASSFTGNLDGRAAGSYPFTYRLTDAFGNHGDWSARSAFTYAPKTPVEVHLGPPVPGGTTRPPTPTDPPTDPVAPIAHPVTPPAGPAGRPSTPPAVSRAVPPVPQTLPDKVIKGARRVVDNTIKGLGEVPKAIKDTLAETIKKPTIPLVLLFVVVGFLLLQNQIDRRDPKLASAPVGAEPELEFGPVLGSRPVPDRPLGGGAPA